MLKNSQAEYTIATPKGVHSVNWRGISVRHKQMAVRVWNRCRSFASLWSRSTIAPKDGQAVR